MRSLEQWLAYLESIHPVSIDMGLQRVNEVAHRLAFNWEKITVITVGGTNGKGTTCKFLESFLRQSNATVATYRSPHLIDYRERVTLNGAMQPHEEYCHAMQRVEDARADISLTYFEFATLAALVMIQKWCPDYLLLEVGLGGRLDATNIVDSDCAVITTIGLDHQEYLGNTEEAIAFEKAGIFRPTKPVIIGETKPLQALIDSVNALKCDVAFASKDFTYTQPDAAGWDWKMGDTTFTGLPLPKIPLQNASTALAALCKLGIPVSKTSVVETCRNAQLPGRMQILQERPDVILDVGHNPQAAQALATWLTQRYNTQHTRFRLVVGMLKDKDINNTLASFYCLHPIWYAATTTGSRGLSSSMLAKSISQQTSVSSYNSVVEAFNKAKIDASNSDVILVFGSFLTVAEVLAYTS